MAARDLTRYLHKGESSGRPGDDSSPGGSLGRAVVMRAPAGYACGLCLSEFQSLFDAQRCLERCCVRTRLRECVHVLASPQGTHYRCSLCSRVRVHREDALRCFESCEQGLRHGRGLPGTLASALDKARSGTGPEGEGGPRAHSARPLVGRPVAHVRPPLFGRDRAALPGANRDILGLPAHQDEHNATSSLNLPHSGITDGLDSRNPDHMGAPGEEQTPRGRPTNVSLSHELADRGASLKGGAQLPLSDAQKAELSRRSEELLLGDVPEGALVQDVSSLGESPAPERGAAFDGLAGAGFDLDASLEEHGEAPTLTLAEPSLPEVYGSAPEPTPDEPAAATNGPMKDADGNVIYREPGMKPFKRADARYVCMACQTKFFTRNDVEKCFEGHPIRAGSELI